MALSFYLSTGEADLTDDKGDNIKESIEKYDLVIFFLGGACGEKWRGADPVSRLPPPSRPHPNSLPAKTVKSWIVCACMNFCMKIFVDLLIPTQFVQQAPRRI